MIYIDSSVALAHLLGEDRVPPAGLWREDLISSRLLEYEVWNRLHAYGLGSSHGEEARIVIGRLRLTSLTEIALARALMPFPRPLRTLDALHLATAAFLQSAETSLRLATYDVRLAECASQLGIPLADL